MKKLIENRSLRVQKIGKYLQKKENGTSYGKYSYGDSVTG